MKLVFFDTGDYLEFEPEKNVFIDYWLEFIITNNFNYYKIESSSYDCVQLDMDKMNQAINLSNHLVKSINPRLPALFEEITQLDQNILNQSHKKWVSFTESYLNELYPAPAYWQDINHYVHTLERSYSIFFKNEKTHFPLDTKYTQYLQSENCEYQKTDLMIHFNNLGRHQHNQWLTSSEVDAETNNYETVSLNFEYQFNLDTGPKFEKQKPPPGYIEWCYKNNIEVLPPYIPVGKFKKYDRFEVRKIMHRNLKNNKFAGFSYD